VTFGSARVALANSASSRIDRGWYARQGMLPPANGAGRLLRRSAAINCSMSNAPENAPDVPSRDLRRERSEGVHRALLAGLLGNVGVKRDKREYEGARGKKFSIFPGSALFKRSPEWVMSAELVETTRLY